MCVCVCVCVCVCFRNFSQSYLHYMPVNIARVLLVVVVVVVVVRTGKFENMNALCLP